MNSSCWWSSADEVPFSTEWTGTATIHDINLIFVQEVNSWYDLLTCWNSEKSPFLRREVDRFCQIHERGDFY